LRHQKRLCAAKAPQGFVDGSNRLRVQNCGSKQGALSRKYNHPRDVRISNAPPSTVAFNESQQLQAAPTDR
jgi:hypothetical protein